MTSVTAHYGLQQFLQSWQELTRAFPALGVRRRAEHVEPPREVQQVVRFGRGTQGDVDEACVVGTRSSCATFYDVCGHRNGGTSHLRLQAEALRDGEGCGVAIDKQNERIRQLEHSELLVISAHGSPTVCTAPATFSCIAGKRAQSGAVISPGVWSREPGA
jgi:hypothetical protein